MYFETFQKCCKHRCPGFDRDHQLIDTCRHKENTPPGSSWGTCDVVHCPMIKEQIKTNGDFVRSGDNAVLAWLFVSALDAAITNFIKENDLQNLFESKDPIQRTKQNIERMKEFLDSPLGEIP